MLGLFKKNKLLNLKQRLDLYGRLLDFAKDKYDILTSITHIGTIAIKRKSKEAYFYSILKDRMRNESSLIFLFEGFLPKEEIAILQIGHESGDAKSCLESLIFSIKSINDIKSKIIGALTTPLFLFFAVILVIAIYRLKVISVYTEFIPLNKWPFIAKSFYDVGSFVTSYNFVVLIAVMILFFIIVTYSLPRFNNSIRYIFFDRIVPYNFYKQYMSTVFMLSLSSMLKSRVSIVDAIDFLKNNSNEWQKYFLNISIDKGRRGEDVVGIIDNGLVKTSIMDMISVYEGLSNVYLAIDKGARLSIQELINVVTLLASIANKIAIILIAFCIVWIFLSMYSLSQVIQSSIQ